jgi:hypothetical protein
MMTIFLFATASRPVLELNHPPILWVPRAPFPGVKRPGRKVDHSPQSVAGIIQRYGAGLRVG